jgi:hypothetical protein
MSECSFDWQSLWDSFIQSMFTNRKDYSVGFQSILIPSSVYGSTVAANILPSNVWWIIWKFNMCCACHLQTNKNLSLHDISCEKEEKSETQYFTTCTHPDNITHEPKHNFSKNYIYFQYMMKLSNSYISDFKILIIWNKIQWVTFYRFLQQI